MDESFILNSKIEYIKKLDHVISVQYDYNHINDQIEHDIYWRILFPDEMQDIMLCYVLSVAPPVASQEIRIRDKIFDIIQTHILSLAKYSNLFGYFVAHKNYKVIWKICNEIWWLAGDTSSDFNFYSKRLIACKIYKKTIEFFVKDDSEKKEKTWYYLRQQIDNVMAFGKFKQKILKLPFIRLLRGVK